MAGQDITTVFNFDADYLMGLVSVGDWAAVWDYLGNFLENLTINASPDILALNKSIQKTFGDEQKKKFVSDFGALAGQLILALLVDESVRLSDKSFSRIIQFHEALHNLFFLMDVRDTDDYVRPFLEKEKNLSEFMQKRILILLSLNTNLDIVSIIKRVDTKYRVPAICSYMRYMKIFEKNIHDNKIRLYAFRHDIEKTASDDDLLTNATVPYFTCSYIDYPHKHDIKKNINNAIRKKLNTYERDFQKIRSSPRRVLDIKMHEHLPRLIIFAEEMSKNHPMNRSWADWVRSLNKSFSTLMVTPSSRFDACLREDFGNVLPFGSIHELVQLCHDFGPDVVIYPSVGLGFFGIVASNMRLAPLQIMGLGHPATSMSDCIDFVYGPECMYYPEAFPNDRYIVDNSAYRFIPRLDRDLIFGAPKISAAPDRKIRVAVIGSNLKLSHPFLQLLIEIQRESPVELHFSFQMGTLGIDSLYVERNLAPHFKDYSYYGWQSYDDYFALIQQADIVLNPFPFGHTNTIIDTLLAGKPCVGMDGPEAAANTEKCILLQTGLQDQFIAHNPKEYKEKFFSILARVRAGDTQFYDPQKVYEQLYHPAGAGGFSDIISQVHQNSDAYKRSGEKLFRL